MTRFTYPFEQQGPVANLNGVDGWVVVDSGGNPSGIEIFDRAATNAALLAYEACFRRLGDMEQTEE